MERNGVKRQIWRVYALSISVVTVLGVVGGLGYGLLRVSKYFPFLHVFIGTIGGIAVGAVLGERIANRKAPGHSTRMQYGALYRAIPMLGTLPPEEVESVGKECSELAARESETRMLRFSSWIFTALALVLGVLHEASRFQQVWSLLVSLTGKEDLTREAVVGDYSLLGRALHESPDLFIYGAAAFFVGALLLSIAHALHVRKRRIVVCKAMVQERFPDVEWDHHSM